MPDAARVSVAAPSRQTRGCYHQNEWPPSPRSSPRLVETFAEERGFALNGYKSTTFRREANARGLEPDECYSIGPLREVPDVAIEVVVSASMVDKLDVYAGLGVGEVWVFKDRTLGVYRLEDGAYGAQAHSDGLAGIDLVALASFVRPDADQTVAVRAYRETLRRG